MNEPILIEGKPTLITTEDYVCCPDGHFYRSIFGRPYIKKFEDSFGFKSSGHANWMVRVCEGEDNERGVVLAGCRVNYFVQMDTPPQLMLSNQVATGQGLLFYPNIYIVRDEAGKG